MSETLLKRNASTNAKTTNGIPLKDTSQANYFFDCDGNKGNAKGSFCCILKKGNEHFILTAGHNLKNTSGKEYKLINDNENYVELVLVKDYRILTEQEKQINDDLQKQGKPFKYFSHDAAVLKINKITENNIDVYNINANTTKNDVITNSKDFYGNVLGKKSGLKIESSLNISEGKASLIAYTSTYREFDYYGIYTNEDNYIDDKNQKVAKDESCSKVLLLGPYDSKSIVDKGTSGDSGGLIMYKNFVLGIYLGKCKRRDNYYVRSRNLPKLSPQDTSFFQLLIKDYEIA